MEGNARIFFFLVGGGMCGHQGLVTVLMESSAAVEKRNWPCFVAGRANGTRSNRGFYLRTLGCISLDPAPVNVAFAWGLK